MSAAEHRRRSGARPSPLAGSWAFVKRHALTVYSLLFFAYLMLPIGVVIAFSFNNPKGRFNYTWQGFTFNNWRNWDGVPGIQSAIELSLEIALLASLVATALGTLIALALVRYGFRGRGVDEPPDLPADVDARDRARRLAADAVPEPDSIGPRGFWTILIAHIMFSISFVVVTVKARLIGFDRHLEEAAMDLGANEWTTFRKVTLPLIAPAILAALLLASRSRSTTSSITYFNAGAGSRSRSSSGAPRASARRRRST